MIFEQEYIVFEILDVLELKQNTYSCTHNTDRLFDAVSFRLSSDAVMDDGKKAISVSDGSICFVPSHITYDRTAANDHMVVVHMKTLNYQTDTIEHFLPEHPENYQKKFLNILDLWNKKEPGYKNLCASVMQDLFADFYRDNLPDAETSKIRDAVSYIRKNCLNQDFSLPDAAKKSYISEPYFRKLFKKEFGMSPKQYVIDARIRHATALILTKYYSLQEVATLCGYKDYKHFSTEFKKIVGVSPSAYTYQFLL